MSRTHLLLSMQICSVRNKWISTSRQLPPRCIVPFCREIQLCNLTDAQPAANCITVHFNKKQKNS
ncbi:hypothetical protein SKAU_G00132070 [Synaphobranchus kaupii]|uniref:Uncharacterized protein n=1 Tax=Synaphobranchus kaupii TaxID=118154 RepID=A0A9Q1FQK9_SYNKA|nr:hypothetical protein SKAU_G00132070 [Synaphobranchus kaupii]